MPSERLAPTPLTKKAKQAAALFFACALLALCLSQGAAAQSGRRNTKKPSPAPTPAATDGPPPAPNESPLTRVSALIIGGHQIDSDTVEDYSTSVSTTVKACTERLKEHSGPPLEIRNGGKMKREEAAERARSVTDAYVLWFGYSTKRVELFYDTVSYVDYVVFMPETAKVLTEGRVFPDEQKKTADPGGIMRLPSVRRPARVPNIYRQLQRAGREMADRVRHKL